MQRWYLDACSLLNLYATGRLEDLASNLNAVFYVMPWVAYQEALFVYERQGMKQGPQVPVDLSMAISSGRLVVEADLSADEELEALVELAAILDRGEAETLAAALCRDGGLVTDERKAIREITARSLDIPVMTSVGLLKTWAEAVQVEQEELYEGLLNVRIGGNFIPGKREPDLEWWNAILDRR